MADPSVEVRPLQPSDGPALAALFTRSGSPCFCRYWHFRGTTDEWLERCHVYPTENEAELRESVASGSQRGIVAQLGDRAPEAALVGWMQVAPATELSKLYAQRHYRSLTLADRQDVWSIGCFLIDTECHGRGLAHALLQEGLRFAFSQGARAVEGFPRCEQSVTRPETVWTGPPRVFRAAGFEVVAAADTPYPVYRLLRPPSDVL